MRLVQGNNHWVGDHQVGVMNIWREESGRVVASLAIHDPRTGQDDTVRVAAGDGLKIGTSKFRVSHVENDTSAARPWLEIEPR